MARVSHPSADGPVRASAKFVAADVRRLIYFLKKSETPDVVSYEKIRNARTRPSALHLIA